MTDNSASLLGNVALSVAGLLPPKDAKSQLEVIDRKVLSSVQKASSPPIISSEAASRFTQHRAPLFEEYPDASIPGNVHLIPDASLERLIETNGAVNLLRQMAKDLAERDSQITEMRKRYEDRERKLKNMLFESGVSRTDVERRLASILQRKPSLESIRSGKPRSEYSYIETLDDQLQEAMSEADFDNRSIVDNGDSQLETPKPKVPRHVSRRDQTGSSTRPPNPSAPQSPEIHKPRRSSALSRWSVGLFAWEGTHKITQPSSSIMAAEDKNPTSLLGAGRGGVTGRSRRRSTASSVPENLPRTPSPSTSSTLLTAFQPERHAAKQDWSSEKLPELIIPLHFRAILEAEATRPLDQDSSVTGGWLVYKSASSTVASLAYNLVYRSHHLMEPDNIISALGDPNEIAVSKEVPQIRSARRMDHLHARLRSMSAPRSQETWIPPVLRDTAQSVLPGVQKHLPDRNTTMELETFIPDAEQPPSMLPAWNDNTLQTNILTDRFGFKLFDARSKQREISAHLGDRDGGADNNEDQINRVIERETIDAIDTAHGPSPFNKSSVSATLLDCSSFPDTVSTKSRTEEVVHHSDLRSAAGLLGPRNIQSINDSVVSPRPLNPETTLNKSGAVFSNERSSARLHMLSQLDLYGADKAKQERWDTFLRKTREDRRKGADYLDLNEDELIGLASLGIGKMAKERRKELVALILGGIPMNYRPKIWGELTGACMLKEPLYYQELLSHGKDVDSICVEQIDLDIRRTMPSNVFFAGIGPGVPKLRRVLLAFSRHNAEVGYCQGMNVIAATLLLTHPTEEDAFFVLVSIVEKILPVRYFTPDLLTSRADQSVLKHLFREMCPQTESHLQGLAIDLEAVTFGWFLSVFTDCLPAECLFRTWDVFFIEGHSYLFCVAIAILKVHEKALQDCESPGQVYTLLKELGRMRDLNIDEFVKTTEQVKATVQNKGYDLM